MIYNLQKLEQERLYGEDVGVTYCAWSHQTDNFGLFVYHDKPHATPFASHGHYMLIEIRAY